ncbi:MAG: GldG family protein, partial [Burkholderiales bacterium]|nr:GldG family protein [Burkholderiales bacterium]
RQVFFLDGHGERRADGGANHDLGEFARRLATKGLKVAPLNLATVQAVPDNAAVLVIAGPQVDLLRVEVDKLLAYVQRGGAVLWMIDEGALHGLQPLADALGLRLDPGVVVDPAAAQVQASATLALASKYAVHPATRAFALTTAFPFARPLAAAADPRGWRFTALVEAAPRGWVETGPLDATVQFDRGRDVAGPVVVAAALERETDGRAQRVAVTGTGHFVANTYVGLVGNLDFGVNLVNWTAGDESLITLEPRPSVDRTLELSRAWLTFIALFFAIALPAGLLFTGAFTWWQRRRA